MSDLSLATLFAMKANLIHAHSGADITSEVANATNATNATFVPWTGVTGKPKTLDEYGILEIPWSILINTPTTMADYGLTDVSHINHTHNSVYAAISHNHDMAYATIAHAHDSSYSPVTHNHNTIYAAISHNHDSSYSSVTHNHNGSYASINHNHDGSYATQSQINTLYYQLSGSGFMGSPYNGWGYQFFPSGGLVQWGRAGAGYTTVPFPLSFSEKPNCVIAAGFGFSVILTGSTASSFSISYAPGDYSWLVFGRGR